MMRVLHVIESMGRGGAERNTALLLAPLRALGVENRLVTLWPGRSYEERVAPYSERYELGLRPGRTLSALPALIRLARDVDFVHTQLTRASIVGRLAAVATGRPSVTTLHTTAYAPDNMARLARGIRRKVLVIRALDAATARTTRHFFAVSPSVKAVHVEALGIAPERIELAPCCIDPEEFEPDGPATALARTPGAFSVLTVGRLIPSKRQADLVRAVHGLPARLHIAGAGAEEGALRALIAELGSPVDLLGVRDDVPSLLRAADIFAFPSSHEGMPVALLEAMAMGRACVASDIPENRDLGGDAVVYFPVGDVPALARALVALGSDRGRREELGRKARARALRYADPGAAAARFVNALQGLR
jgi:glycosyltransferase involved in cell wall biosynthesis